MDPRDLRKWDEDFRAAVIAAVSHRFAMHFRWLALVLLLVGCASTPPAPTATPEALAAAATTFSARMSGAQVFVGAGDIANCDDPDFGNAKATSDVILAMFPEATVFTAGDNAYQQGTIAQYTNCYNPTWGRMKDRTKPSPGNHEYKTAGAAGYFAYFAGIPHDYSFDLGDWHIISLDSGKDGERRRPAQLAWLENDLRETTQPCIAAFWHHPLYSSGSQHGNNANMKPFWDRLLARGADVVINGHDHDYERFAPQNASAAPDPSGIREFVAGTGGKELRTWGTIRPNSEKRLLQYGVLALFLRSGSYDWAFIDTTGDVLDQGSGDCH